MRQVETKKFDPVNDLLGQDEAIENITRDNHEYFLKNGFKRKYYTVTWGCQMNEHDTEKLEGILEMLDYEKTDKREDANIIIFNTCLVRENAELKVYGNLGELKALKAEKEDLILAVCGCMMQRENVREVIRESYRHVDLVFGTHNSHNLPALINKCKSQKKRVTDVWEDGREIVENLPTVRKYDFKAFVNIMYGCNNFCTYCIVPYTRGRERSRLPEEIIEEVRKLAEKGCKEITLLGQNVNSYGKTLETPMTFAELLRELNKIEGLERIRFMTSHPKDISDELIYAVRDCDKVCNHLHLPFQAGSDKILESMNRKYTKEQYLNLIEKVRKEVPAASLTTDIIVGFPGETDDDFEHTLEVVKKAKFDSAYTFLYSIREGTPAAEMENQVSQEDKNNRFQKLLNVLHPISLEFNQQFIGKTLDVLVEGFSKNNKEVLAGRTEQNKLVHFKGDSSLIGTIVKVRVETAKTWTLDGVLV